jgi:hypothetical protein
MKRFRCSLGYEDIGRSETVIIKMWVYVAYLTPAPGGSPGWDAALAETASAQSADTFVARMLDEFQPRPVSHAGATRFPRNQDS